MTVEICQPCHGNGYIKVKESTENPVDVIHQCPSCNSQGEIMSKTIIEKTLIEETNKTLNIFDAERRAWRERNRISYEHVRKLEDQIDMLEKQKKFLQSKLKEKGVSEIEME
jgi:hypothetical protein